MREIHSYNQTILYVVNSKQGHIIFKLHILSATTWTAAASDNYYTTEYIV